MVKITYPGVYVEEVEKPHNTITGVSTSVTGFIGRAKKGPTSKAIRISGFKEFESIFGGLWSDSPMSYSINQFFQNGGKEAVIVRVEKNASSANAIFEGTGIELVASNAGEWANGIKVKISQSSDLQITIQVRRNSLIEEFVVELEPSSQLFIGSVLKTRSQFIRLKNGIDISLMSLPVEGQEITLTQGNDGDIISSEQIIGTENLKSGIQCFDDQIINLMVVPPLGPNDEVDSETLDKVAKYCQKNNVFLIVDSPITWISKDLAFEGMRNSEVMTPNENAAIFFPRILIKDPARGNQIMEFTSSGAIAGMFARTDAERGVWKTPAGIEAVLNGVENLVVNLTDDKISILNKTGLNCLRNYSTMGIVNWGARTSVGMDDFASQWKYISVRRTAIFIEKTLQQYLHRHIFDVNDVRLWARIRQSVENFMHHLFRQGAFQGTNPNDAYYVKCDEETTTPYDVDNGVLNIILGFAPLKPAEFTVIKISLTNIQT